MSQRQEFGHEEVLNLKLKLESGRKSAPCLPSVAPLMVMVVAVTSKLLVASWWKTKFWAGTGTTASKKHLEQVGGIKIYKITDVSVLKYGT